MDGWQEDVDETLDRDATPIERVLDEKGDQLIVKVPFVDPPIYVAVWKVDVGRIPLYLMDTDIQINDPWNRRISAHLYIGDIEQRLRQEIILGIGGYRGVKCPRRKTFGYTSERRSFRLCYPGSGYGDGSRKERPLKKPLNWYVLRRFLQLIPLCPRVMTYSLFISWTSISVIAIPFWDLAGRLFSRWE